MPKQRPSKTSSEGEHDPKPLRERQSGIKLHFFKFV